MIVIVDYRAGNLASVRTALDHLGIHSRIVSTGEELRRACVDSACRIVFPGVGHARAAMATLKRSHLDSALREAFESGIPILGICLGAQIILSHSEEGDTACLDLVAGGCPRFHPSDRSLKIPHMGWNEVAMTQPHPVLEDVKAGDEFYFVHSYYARPDDASHVFATCEHGIAFPAAIGYRNLFATQFHPEKSGRIGLDLLRNFYEWDGSVQRPQYAE
ncbi:MAG: imidazole glycerol phosphate synthase subunit HisH [Anaerolineae bacterium]